MKNLELIETEDGSYTIKNIELDEIYHSVYGAINESQHVFIEAGLHALPSSIETINSLEVGLGTGLNALLTYREHLKNTYKINYLALEPFPLPNEIIKEINHPKILNLDNKIFLKIHDSYNEKASMLSERFSLKVLQQKLQDFDPGIQEFDLIYFDAFSPPVQPELWTEAVFEKIAKSMKPGAILVTYSSRGTVKRALKAAGLTIEKIPGPKGKRDMVRAGK